MEECMEQYDCYSDDEDSKSEEEDTSQQPNSDEIRAKQAELYRKLAENTLSETELMSYTEYLDMDIKIALCEDCIDGDEFHPGMLQDIKEEEAIASTAGTTGEEQDKRQESSDKKQTPQRVTDHIQHCCDQIINGECHEIESEQKQKKMRGFRLSHMCATNDSFLPVLLHLHQHGCDVNSFTIDTVAQTCLGLAIQYNQYKTFQALLSMNVDISLAAEGRPQPIVRAVELEHDEMFNDLLARTDVKSLNAVGNSFRSMPLLIRCIRFHPQYVETLLKAGADPNVAMPSGSTAIMYAVNTYDIGILKLLIQYGADVNLKNNRNDAPLLVSVYREETEMVRILLEAGADPNFVASGNGNNSLLIVCTYDGCLEILKLLLKHGANAAFKNDLDYTALHIAAWNGHKECVRELLKAGVAWDIQTQDKNTPLALAAHGGHLSVIQELLPLGCDVNNRDKDDDTPLMYAAYNGMTEAVELLIQNGADVNLKNSKNCNALWNAVFVNSKDIVKLLVLENAELETSSIGINQHAQSDTIIPLYNSPKSVLWVAVQRASPDITLLLISAGYNLYKEDWLMQSEFPESTLDSDAVQRLQSALLQYVHTPPRLITACRNYFRCNFRKNLQSKVSKLPIPISLQRYITMEDLRHSVEIEKQKKMIKVTVESD